MCVHVMMHMWYVLCDVRVCGVMCVHVMIHMWCDDAHVVRVVMCVYVV